MLTNTNMKLKKSSTEELEIWSWSLPQVVTCPGAKTCKQGCFGLQGNYNFPSVKSGLQNRYELSQTEDFVPTIIKQLNKLLKKGKKIAVRIHAVGDFYSVEYARKWQEIIEYFEDKGVIFYCYTKSVQIVRKTGLSKLPNMTVRYSEGGHFDYMIQPTDLVARVVESQDDETVDAIGNEDDLLCIDKSIKVLGLVYHGASSKKWSTTPAKLKRVG